LRVAPDERSDWVIILESIDSENADREAKRVLQTSGILKHATVEVGVFQHIVTKYHQTSKDF